MGLKGMACTGPQQSSHTAEAPGMPQVLHRSSRRDWHGCLPIDVDIVARARALPAKPEDEWPARHTCGPRARACKVTLVVVIVINISLVWGTDVQSQKASVLRQLNSHTKTQSELHRDSREAARYPCPATSIVLRLRSCQLKKHKFHSSAA